MAKCNVSGSSLARLVARSGSARHARRIAYTSLAHSSTVKPAEQQYIASTLSGRRLFSQSIPRQHATPVDNQSTAFTRSQAPVRPDDTQSSSSSSETPLVRFDQQEGKIGVTWSSGVESTYHSIWLRDHCRCAECYHPQTKQRQLDTFTIPADIQPFNVEATTEGLLVHWPKLKAAASESTAADALRQQQQQQSQANGEAEQASSSSLTVSSTSTEPVQEELHASLYPWSWLYANSYAPVLSSGASHANRNSPSSLILWGRGIAQQPPTVTFDEVMDAESERGVARWVNKIAQFGFCFVSGVPVTPEDTERLIKRIAFIRETHYGAFWDFTSDLSHGDTAYTNLPLGAHTDTTYFTDPAGLQLFHLLSHTASVKADKTPAQGGASLLVDGFFAAKILREVHPEAYEILSTTPISTHSAGDDATLIRPLQSGGYPILEHDHQTGDLIRVRYNNDDRSVLRVAADVVVPFYDALRKWNEVLRHNDSEYWTQLDPGTAMIFDNHRVLHGRSAFTGNRRLCGAYVNHDDYRSRLAVLQKQFPQFAIDSALSVRRGAAAASPDASSAATLAATAQAPVTRRGVWDDGL